MRLYLVRHGLCKHNMPNPDSALPDPLCASKIEYDQFVLTPQGMLQAELTGWCLRNVDFDCVYSSYLIRTVQTATGILKFQNRIKPLHLEAELAEITDFSEGNFPFLPTEVYRTFWHEIDPPTDPTVTGMRRCPVEENGDVMWERAVRFRDYILQKHTGEDEKILLVSHGSFMKEYLVPALLFEERNDPHFCCEGFGNCSVTEIEYINGQRRIHHINDTGHLRYVQ